MVGIWFRSNVEQTLENCLQYCGKCFRDPVKEMKITTKGFKSLNKANILRLSVDLKVKDSAAAVVDR